MFVVPCIWSGYLMMMSLKHDWRESWEMKGNSVCRYPVIETARVTYSCFDWRLSKSKQKEYKVEKIIIHFSFPPHYCMNCCATAWGSNMAEGTPVICITVTWFHVLLYFFNNQDKKHHKITFVPTWNNAAGGNFEVLFPTSIELSLWGVKTILLSSLEHGLI